MPLTEKVEFKAQLQMGFRFQIPRPIRWQFKLEPDQVFKVSITWNSTIDIRWEHFYGQMTKDGRITLPKLNRQLLVQDIRENKGAGGIFLLIQLQPASTPK